MAACTVTPLAAVGGFRASFEVIAAADADTTATIAHGIACPGATDGAKDAYAKAKLEVVLAKLTAAARLSDWVVTTVDRTNVVLTKTAAVGSGAAPAQLRVFIEAPASMLELLP